MSQRPATPEQIAMLIDNCQKTDHVLYEEIFHDMIIESIIKKGILDNEVINKEYAVKLLHLDSNLSLMIMSVCIIFSTELQATYEVEKMFLLKRIVMVCHEGYKYLFGFTNNETAAKRFLAIMEATNPHTVSFINEASVTYKNRYGNNLQKQIRDVGKHYSDNSFELFSIIKDLTERDVTNMVNSFMAMAQPLKALTTDKIAALTRTGYICAKLQKIGHRHIDTFLDKKLTAQLDYSIKNQGSVIMQMGNSIFQANKLLIDSGIDTSNIELKPFISDNIGEHILYVLMDVLCSLKAFANAKEYQEQMLHLAYVRLSIHEGLKKLYGFTDKEHQKSYWTRLKCDFADVAQPMKIEISNLERKFECLSFNTYIASDEVVSLTHYGETKHENIPYKVLGLLSNVSKKEYLAVIVDVANTFNSILPLVGKLMTAKSKQISNRTENHINDWFNKFDNLFQSARANATSEMQKKIDALDEDFKNMKQQLLKLMK